jgi:hypothetical protein
MVLEDERSAWISPLRWDGQSWCYSWGSLQELEWASRDEPNRAAAFAGRASLMQRLLKQNDKVITLEDDTSVLVYRRIDSLDCIVVDSYPPLFESDPLFHESDPHWADHTAPCV